MRPNEVMIGDWLWFTDPDTQETAPVQIEKDDIGYDGVGFWKLFTPIPITAEILTANGFEKKENHSGCHYANYIEHSPVYAEQTIGDQWEIDIYQNGKIEMCVRYVHELQHILRLQGLTDFADQFKVKGGQP